LHAITAFGRVLFARIFHDFPLNWRIGHAKVSFAKVQNEGIGFQNVEAELLKSANDDFDSNWTTK
jgi:hypothetical protein